MHVGIIYMLSLCSGLVFGQEVVPLASKRFRYPDGIPYKVDTDQNQPRGDQLGYNACNSTTEGPSSLCQTAVFNSLDDFCIWAPPNSKHTVGEVEGEMVAWCTKPGHGTRVIPPGTISGIQLTRTPDYIQVVGFMDQTKINMLSGDSGGEMDPHGADGRGNPIGGILFTNAFSGQYAQVVEWHSFMGSNRFCLKACDQSQSNAPRYCEHIFDRIGCEFNAPSNARDGVFESCAGDSQDFPGVYTDSAGKIQRYTQPPESISAGPVATIPFTARVPRSSLCSQFKSAEIYGGGVTVPVPFLPLTPTPTSAPSSHSQSSSTITSTHSFIPSYFNPLPSPRHSTTPGYRLSLASPTGISNASPVATFFNFNPPSPTTATPASSSFLISSGSYDRTSVSVSTSDSTTSSSTAAEITPTLNLSPNIDVSVQSLASHASDALASMPSESGSKAIKATRMRDLVGLLMFSVLVHCFL